jgi:PAS domain S-box-containing protein
MANRRHLALFAATAAYVIAVALVDWLTPIVLDVWVLYLPVILVPIWMTASRPIIITALFCTALMCIDASCSSHPTTARIDVLCNLGMGLVALWLTAIAGVTIVRRSAEASQKSKALAVSEERLRLAMEGAGMGTWDRDLQSDMSIWSDTHFRMLGYAPTASGHATVQMWRALLHPDDAQRVLETQEEARKNRAVFCTEYRIFRADNGRIAWLSMVGRCVYNTAGEAVRFLGVSFDISQRKQLEREVLDIASQQQRQIGHELHDSVGQELTGLGLMANSLVQTLPTTAPHRRVIDRLINGLDRVRLQVRNLSRGLVPVEVETKGLCAALDDLASRSQMQSGIEVQFTCSEKVELPNHEWATQLFHIAQEALSNALRHANARHIHITLGPESAGLRLQVEDDGIGMANRRLQEHDGMGLHIMRYRAEQIGAMLQIGPAQQGGTLVACTLPNSNHSQVNGNSHYYQGQYG